MGGRGEGTISSILKRKKKVEIICSRLHSLSDPCSFCPVRVCRGMECRELVAQVTEDSPNWGGWGKPEIRNCRKLLSFPGCKDGGRSCNTFQKLAPPSACPSGDPTAERRGKYHPPTTSSPAHASYWPNAAWCRLSREPANIPATPTDQAQGRESTWGWQAQICTRETVLKQNQL